ncbi:hypothetical protein, partial [Xanthomonas campestris]
LQQIATAHGRTTRLPTPLSTTVALTKQQTTKPQWLRISAKEKPGDAGLFRFIDIRRAYSCASSIWIL